MPEREGLAPGSANQIPCQQFVRGFRAGDRQVWIELDDPGQPVGTTEHRADLQEPSGGRRQGVQAREDRGLDRIGQARERRIHGRLIAQVRHPLHDRPNDFARIERVAVSPGNDTPDDVRSRAVEQLGHEQANLAVAERLERE